jgi:head-tail adaptor
MDVAFVRHVREPAEGDARERVRVADDVAASVQVSVQRIECSVSGCHPLECTNSAGGIG